MHKVSIDYDKEDLKVLINDQKLNISVLDYIKISSNYDWYLKVIRFFGNFTTYEHIVAILNGDCSKTKIFNDLNNMCSLHLLRREKLGNYIYFVLTKKAQIYLKQRNNVGYIPNPSIKALKSNILLADYLINNQINFVTAKIRKSKNKLGTLVYEFTDYENYIKCCYMHLYNKMKNIKGIKENFLKEQIELTNKDDILVKSEKNTRIVKSYDIFSKLMLKNVYINKLDTKPNSMEITFLILDISYSINWYKKIILLISNSLKQLYFSPLEQSIKYNLVVQTDNKENEINLSKKLRKIVVELKEVRDNYIKRNTSEDVFNGKIIYDFNLEHMYLSEKYAWGLNNISFIEYNSSRFFETRGDKINTIDPEQLNIIDFSLNKNA